MLPDLLLFWFTLSTLKCDMHTCTVSYCKYKALNMAELINLQFLITATEEDFNFMKRK